MNQTQRRLFLIQSLLNEKTEYRDISIPAEPESQRQLLRGLMNIRNPRPIDADFLAVQDDYLQGGTGSQRHYGHRGFSLCSAGAVPPAGGYYNPEILFLELGVGYKTPGIIKYPFWQMTAKNSEATYASINQGQALCPQEIRQRSICIDRDIMETLAAL